MNKTYLAGGIIATALLVAFVMLRANEDAWICTNGLWEKHGNPGAPMPNSECGDIALAQTENSFSNGQPYKIFVVNEFSVHYPNWSDIPPPLVPATDVIPIAVANNGCAFMIRVSQITAGMTFKEYVENQFKEQQKKISLNILTKNLNDTQSHLEAEIMAGASTLKNVSSTFLLKGSHTVSIAFAGEKSKFEKTCAPLLSEVLASVKFQ